MIRSNATLPILLTAVLAATATVRAQQPVVDPHEPPAVTIERTNGAVAAGRLDSRTNSQSLWLQRTRGRIAISFQIPWEQVAAGAIAGRSLDVDQLKQTALQLKPTHAVRYVDLPSPTRSERHEVQRAAVERESREQVAPLRQARYLQIYAKTANWDADVPRDGVQLRLTLRDQQDEPLAQAGVLRATLWGIRKSSNTRPGRWTRIATWNQWTKLDAFEHGSAVVRLRYPGAPPQLSTGYTGDAILHVSYQPRRQGPLEASQQLRLRPFNYLRDQLEATTGNRFLPGERTR